MPSGSSFQEQQPFDKESGRPYSADSLGRPKVIISGVTTSLAFPVTANNDCESAITTMVVTAAGTKLVKASTSASIRVHGFSICNDTTNYNRRFELRWGDSTAFWRGSIAAGVPFNWNLLNSTTKMAGKKITIYASGTVTATCTVFWKAV